MSMLSYRQNCKILTFICSFCTFYQGCELNRFLIKFDFKEIIASSSSSSKKFIFRVQVRQERLSSGSSSSKRYLRVQVRVQKILFFEFGKNDQVRVRQKRSSSSLAKTIKFATLTVSLSINATWKEFWSLLMLVLTNLYNCLFNVLRNMFSSQI